MASVDRLWTSGEGPVARAALALIPAIALTVCTTVAAVVPGPASISPSWMLGIALVALTWEIALFTVPTIRGDEPRAFGWYVVGFAVFAAALCAIQPWFGFYAWGLYLRVPMIEGAVARWSALGWTAVVMGTCQIGGLVNLRGAIVVAWLALVGINFGVGAIMIALVRHGRAQAVKDSDNITELTEANRRLADEIAKNRRLQDELVEQARAAGVLDERARMAGEIHDTIAQGLAGVVAQLEAAQSSEAARDQHIATAQRLARDSLAEARRSVRALQPASLSRGRLREALQHLVDQWSAGAGATARLVVSGTPTDHPVEVEVELYRVAQEALANAARHADAGQVTLTLTYSGDTVLIDVHDDGVGFDPDAPPPTTGGFGLRSMATRMSRVGGALEVVSAAGSGTTVTAVVPAQETAV